MSGRPQTFLPTLAQQQVNELNIVRANLQRKLYDYFMMTASRYDSSEIFVEAFEGLGEEDENDLVEAVIEFMYEAAKAPAKRGNNPLNDFESLVALKKVVDIFMSFTPSPVTQGAHPPTQHKSRFAKVGA